MNKLMFFTVQGHLCIAKQKIQPCGREHPSFGVLIGHNNRLWIRMGPAMLQNSINFNSMQMNGAPKCYQQTVLHQMAAAALVNKFGDQRMRIR